MLKREWTSMDAMVVKRVRGEDQSSVSGLEEQSRLSTDKRRRIESSSLGVGVREAITEEIQVGRKKCRFGIVSRGTPFWEWAVPAGGVLSWIWGSNLGERLAGRLGTFWTCLRWT